jgi:hypothetical protein
MPFIGSGIFPILTTVFWIWMLADCIFNKRLHGSSKICWFLVIFFANFVGALIYFFMECQHRNPIEALNYYANAFTKATRPTTTPPFYTPPQPTPPTYMPPATNASDYAQGYRAQKPAPPPVQPSIHPNEAAPAQADYEETIISYPEMPPPQQGG